MRDVKRWCHHEGKGLAGQLNIKIWRGLPWMCYGWQTEGQSIHECQFSSQRWATLISHIISSHEPFWSKVSLVTDVICFIQLITCRSLEDGSFSTSFDISKRIIQHLWDAKSLQFWMQTLKLCRTFGWLAIEINNLQREWVFLVVVSVLSLPAVCLIPKVGVF